MTVSLRTVLATIVAVGLTLAVAAASTVTRRLDRSADARLRVAFSARPERIERCRTLSAEELANVPAHMRQRVLCEGATAHYRLEVRRDDSLVASALLRGGGLRHDRRLYVLRELSLPSGPSTIDVRLARVDTVAARSAEDSSNAERHEAGEQRAPGAGRDDDDRRDDRDGARHDDREDEALSRELDEHRRRVADEVPPSLVLREQVSLAPREVLLVTYDQASRRLRTVRGSP